MPFFVAAALAQRLPRTAAIITLLFGGLYSYLMVMQLISGIEPYRPVADLSRPAAVRNPREGTAIARLFGRTVSEAASVVMGTSIAVYEDRGRTDARGSMTVADEITDLTELAFEGGTPLTTTPIVGASSAALAPTVEPGVEPVRDGEIRVTVLGSGDPFVKKSQASASLLIEVGNPERDLFFFDLGSGALANYNGLRLPVTATTKVFLTHLHADHVGDMPTLVWSLAKGGRRDPVEVWGPAGDAPELGTRSYTQHLEAAHAWDMQSLRGHPGQSGAHMETTEVPWDRTATVYQRNGVQISSFPVIHILNGSVGYRLDYNGRSVVFSGDTRPCHPLVEACDGADLLIHETFPSAPGSPEGGGTAGILRTGCQVRTPGPSWSACSID